MLSSQFTVTSILRCFFCPIPHDGGAITVNCALRTERSCYLLTDRSLPPTT